MRSLRWALWACLVVAGCSRSHPEAGGDSSTHWLRRCGADDQCGGLSCVCGVCSTECSASSECAGLGSNAVCAPSAISACVTGAGSAPRLCDQTCEQDQDCGGAGLRCVEQRCRREASSSAEDAATSSEAAVPSSSANDGGGTRPLDGAPAETDAAGGATSDGGVTDAGLALNALALQCPAQRARSSGDLCTEVTGFAWSGVACEQITCGCLGEDCAAIAPTRAECEAMFAACQPTSMCSGLPWYRCNDYCPAHWVLQGGGRSFGECQGDCSFELALSPAIVLDVGGCTQLNADLTIKNTDGTQRVVNMELTDAAWKQAALLSLALEGANIAPVTGCPDCVDQGEAHFSRLAPNSATGVETFRYEYNRSPEGLRPLDSFIQRLINQARECRGDLLAHCGSYSAQPTPRCGPGLPIANTSCECGVPFEQLSTLKGTSCSASCGSCQVAGSTCGATCIQPCAGGEPVWDPYCTE